VETPYASGRKRKEAATRIVTRGKSAPKGESIKDARMHGGTIIEEGGKNPPGKKYTLKKERDGKKDSYPEKHCPVRKGSQARKECGNIGLFCPKA